MVPREFKRSLKKDLHFVKKFGLRNHCERAGISDLVFFEQLKGRLGFFMSVEPESKMCDEGRAVLAQIDEEN